MRMKWTLPLSLLALFLLASPSGAALRVDWAVADLPGSWHLLRGYGEKGFLGGFVEPLWGENPSPVEDLSARSNLIALIEGEELKALEEKLRAASQSGERFSLEGAEAELFFLREHGRDSCYALLKGSPPRAIAISLLDGGRDEALKLLSRIKVEGPSPVRREALGVGSLDHVRGLAVDGRGGLFAASTFSDSDRNGIALFDASGRLVRKVEAGVERVPYMAPIDLRLCPEGDLLVLDPEALYRFSPEGRYLGLVAGDLDGAGGLAVDGEGNLYVAEKGSSSILKLDPAGRRTGRIGEGKLSLPKDYWDLVGLAVGPGGKLYVADAGNGRIAVFDEDGRLIESFYGASRVKGVFLDVRFSREPPPFKPAGMAITPAGDLLVVDELSGALLLFSPDGSLKGSFSLAAGDLLSSPAGSPRGVAVDPASGRAFVSLVSKPSSVLALEIGEKPLVLAPPGPKPDQGVSPHASRPSSPEAQAVRASAEPPASPSPSTSQAPSIPSARDRVVRILLPAEDPEVGRPYRMEALVEPPPAGPVRYVWSVGDGSSPYALDEPSLEHLFSRGGEVEVSLKVFDVATREMIGSARASLSVRSSGPELKTKEERYQSGRLKLVYSYYVGPDGKEVKHGPEVSYYENGRKRWEGSYEHGLKEGLWVSYYDNGVVGQRGTYRKGLREGLWTLYYRNGNKESEGRYRNDKREGVWVSYLPDGRKFSEMTYRGGKVVPGSVKQF